ncbi:MAG: hypothetical protein ACI4Q3_10670 [Kiritimatiellia bacterium]
MFLGQSLYAYPLWAEDVAALDDLPQPPRGRDLPEDPVIILIRPGAPDALVRGRRLVAAAAAAGKYIDVRVVFVPTIGPYNLPAIFVRALRHRHRFHGTGIYRMRVRALREMGLERALRTLDNPQLRKGADRAGVMRNLQRSLRENGYDYSRPVDIMLCRSRGNADSLRQGHHRIGACLACGIETLSVRFSAAGALPRWMVGLVGRPRERMDIVRSALESRYAVDIERLVPCERSNGDSVIVVPKKGGRFIAQIHDQPLPRIGLASVVAVPLVVIGALFIDLAVIRSAHGTHSIVAWSQFIFPVLSAAMMICLAVFERGVRAAYCALAGVFAAMSFYELLRDIESVHGDWIWISAALAATVFAAVCFCRSSRSFVRGVKRIRRQRTFAVLPLGMAIVLLASKFVSSREFMSFFMTDPRIVRWRSLFEEATEMLGYVMLFGWSFAYFCSRIRERKRW